jgi:hypothetical protein
MGRINLFIIFLVVIIVGTSFSSMNRRAENISEAMNRYHREFQMKSIGSFAMNYGIFKLEAGEILLEDQEMVVQTPNFSVGNSMIDSIRFIPGAGDTIQVIPYVRGDYSGTVSMRESKATLGFGISQPEEQFAYYMFNEGSGTTVRDSSGHGFHGTMTNMSSDDWVTGVEGYALDFDAVNDYVALGQDIAQQYSDKLTVAVWLKQDAASHQNWGNIITENSDGNGNQITGFTLRNKVKFRGASKNHRIEYEFEMTTTGGKKKVSLTVYNGTMDLLDWHYVAGIFDPESQTMTIGIVDQDIWSEINISSNTLPSRSSNSNITLGSIEGGGNGLGKKSGVKAAMDSPRLIADAMTKEELRQLMIYHGVKKTKIVDWRI